MKEWIVIQFIKIIFIGFSKLVLLIVVLLLIIWYLPPLLGYNEKEKVNNPLIEGFDDYCTIKLNGNTVFNQEVEFITNDPNNYDLSVEYECVGIGNYPDGMIKANMSVTSPIGKTATFDLKHESIEVNSKLIDRYFYYDLITEREALSLRSGSYKFKFYIDGEKIHGTHNVNVIFQKDR
ncbi:hypothetical protein [Niallia sp. FSL M8-0099]|uniref:hypothetical protein n=1 Tax=Niallia sp. FSL M8-0099 TaxID=2954519 RepID=UPI0030F7BF3C